MNLNLNLNLPITRPDVRVSRGLFPLSCHDGAPANPTIDQTSECLVVSSHCPVTNGPLPIPRPDVRVSRGLFPLSCHDWAPANPTTRRPRVSWPLPTVLLLPRSEAGVGAESSLSPPSCLGPHIQPSVLAFPTCSLWWGKTRHRGEERENSQHEDCMTFPIQPPRK